MTEPTLLSTIEESGAPQTVAAGPGKRLREARESQRLSVSKVANLLHLDPRLVGALEHNDYEHLPEPIYVTGYLRNYARLLDIPEDEVVSSYRQLDIPPPPILSDLTRKTQHRMPLNHMLIQWGAVGLVAVGLVLVSWHMSTQRAPSAPAADRAPAEAKAPAPVSPPAGGGGRAHAGPMVKGRTVAMREQAADDAAAQPPAPATTAEAADRMPVPVPVPAAAAGTVTPDRAAAPSPPGPSAGAPLQTAAAGTATVMLQFDHDSWVEMTDATGQRVFFDLGKAGATRTVHGAPPFKVLLGYSPGVSIEYNGKPFDQSAYTGSNHVARFTMGTKQ